MTNVTENRVLREKNLVLVKRIENNSLTPSDLKDLFLNLRNITHGILSIRDIADFIAHPGERDKGLLVDRVRDFTNCCAMMSFSLQSSGSKVKYFPYFAPDALCSLQNQYGEKELKREFGLDKVGGSKLLKSFIERLSRKENGWYEVPATVPNQEITYIKKLIGPLIVRPAIQQEALFADFEKVLQMNKLRENKGRTDLTTFSARLSLFVLRLLQGVTVKTRHFGSARLVAAIEKYNENQLEKLGVQIEFNMPLSFKIEPSKTGPVRMTIFETDLQPTSFFGDALKKAVNSGPNLDLPELLEIRDDWILHEMTST